MSSSSVDAQAFASHAKHTYVGDGISSSRNDTAIWERASGGRISTSRVAGSLGQEETAR